jgi:hypothetical protein
VSPWLSDRSSEGQDKRSHAVPATGGPAGVARACRGKVGFDHILFLSYQSYYYDNIIIINIIIQNILYHIIPYSIDLNLIILEHNR